MSSISEANKNSRTPQAVWVCAAIELLTSLGTAIITVPATSLIEGAVCQRYYGAETILAEHLCKSDGVQSDMAYLLGAMSSFASLPGLLFTIPYGILAEHIDRRIILLVNNLSTVFSMLYQLLICHSPHTNLKLMWLSPIFEIFGGGGSVFQMILHTIIAEAIPAASLTTVFYRLSGVSLLIRLLGVSLGSWLLQNGAVSTMLVGISVIGLVLPLLTFLPQTGPNAMISLREDASTELSYIQCDQNETPETQNKTPRHTKILRSSRHHITGEILASLKPLTSLILHNRAFNMCLGIMFLNTVALSARHLLRPWLSKRYDWTLAKTGYILSIESVLSVAILFLLQHFDSAARWKSKTSNDKQKRELWIAKISLVCGTTGSVILSLAETRVLFVVAAVVISGSVGFIDATKAYFTAQLDTRDIGRLYSMIMVVDTLGTILSSPVWSTIYSLGYAWGDVWQGLPFLCSAGVMGLTLMLVMILRA